MTNLKPRPKVLLVTLSLARGGTEGHICEIASRLAARGWPVTVYCLLEGGALAASLIGQGVEVAMPAKHRNTSGSNALRALSAAPNFYSTLRTLKPDIVHFFLPAAYLIGAPMALLARVPVRIMSRRSQNTYQKAHLFSAGVERQLHRRMTAILGNSRRVVHELISQENCSADQTGLIYNGVAIDKFAACGNRADTRRALGIDDSQFVMAIAANLIPYKGHDDLLHALAGVKSQLPPSWVLLCLGRDDGIGVSLKALVTDLGLDGHVKFLGSRADVPELLLASDLGVLASHEEGFSNAVLEGMAAGLPMVVTDVGGNAEAVLDGITGHVVPPHDPAALGRAIASLASDTALARQMGDAGRQRAETRFSMEACLAAYERVYEGLVDGRNAGELAVIQE